MNNEEKIISMLEGVTTRLDKVDTRLDKMDDRLDDISGRVRTLEAETEDVKRTLKATASDVADIGGHLNRVEREVSSLAVMQEVELRRDIKVVAEGHGLIMEKLDALNVRERLDTLEAHDRVSLMAVSALAREVEDLKRAR